VNSPVGYSMTHIPPPPPGVLHTPVLHAGVLTSRPTARDIKISSFSLNICGNELIQV
jgi:hypothetical protein